MSLGLFATTVCQPCVYRNVSSPISFNSLVSWWKSTTVLVMKRSSLWRHRFDAKRRQWRHFHYDVTECDRATWQQTQKQWRHNAFVSSVARQPITTFVSFEAEWMEENRDFIVRIYWPAAADISERNIQRPCGRHTNQRWNILHFYKQQFQYNEGKWRKVGGIPHEAHESSATWFFKPGNQTTEPTTAWNMASHILSPALLGIDAHWPTSALTEYKEKKTVVSEMKMTKLARWRNSLRDLCARIPDIWLWPLHDRFFHTHRSTTLAAWAAIIFYIVLIGTLNSWF